MEQSALLLIVFTVMVAGQTIDNPMFPLEYCGNRTACFNMTYMEKPDEFCKQFTGKVEVPSKLCVNGMILCDGPSHSTGCLYSVNQLRNNCDYAKDNCYADLVQSAIDPDPENPIFPVAACGNRTACSHAKHVERTDAFCKDYAGTVVLPSKLCLNAMIWCENRRLRGSCYYSPNTLSKSCNYAQEKCYKDLVLPETTTAGYTETPTESFTAEATTVEYDTTTGAWYTTSSKAAVSDSTTDGWYTTTSGSGESGETTVEYDTTDGEVTNRTTTNTDVETTTTQQAPSAGPRAGDPCTSAGKRAGNADGCLKFLECTGEVYSERTCSPGYIYYEAFSFCLPGNGKECQLFG
ncbi:uncharacterized protein LOC126568323 [Anopheles maculipalpis]|uniref:uncharacterized protein LOC126568323 n=1 Tax=Anopheles maculipalpis TaxID=1496333 RepID=UPI0021595E2F|nr:uncharacterized protein LOC126568323 [Anopheles maculipalpis]